jgi:hypothetical protein
MGAMHGLLGMVAIGALGLGGPATADASPTAAALMEGGEFCFDMTPPGQEGFLHLMLVTEAAGDTMAEVHAIQRGNVGAPEYANQLAGTATIAPSNDVGTDAPTLYISLTGSGVVVGRDGSAEHWTFSYNLALDPATLTGKIYGAEFQSNPVGDGRPFSIKATYGVQVDLKPMACGDY